MQKHLELTRNRLQNFASETHLHGKIYPLRAPIKLSTFAAPGRVSYPEAVQGDYRPLQIGEQFGPRWSTHWVKVEIEVPPSWKGQEVHLLWDSTSEACIWQDGEPLQGLTGSSSAWGAQMIRGEYPLHFHNSKHARGGEKIILYIEVAVNNLFGFAGEPFNPNMMGLLRQAEIAVFDRQAWDLYWDFKIIADMALYLPADTPRGGQALYAANAMVNEINLDDKGTWKAAQRIAKDFYADHNGGGQHNLSAVGHAHIDTAWLWPLAETRRKCIRTFATTVSYMEDYPDYIFACSQAQQYEWIKEMTPGLYQRIRKKVKDGKFVPTGGSWVEPDCNIPSGEALVRQFLYGQRYFRKEFGVTCREFWEPDVFGYSAALPQILRQAGIENFLTQKLSWNQFNKPASHTFWWEGLDGSRVFVHFPPADTYNSMANVKEVLYNVSNYKDHERSKESYLLFGYGDGGGGPDRNMLEQLQRMKNVDGLPRVEIRTPSDFFERCRDDAKDLLTWVGELYFELHRGTYTTQAKTKLGNRRSEFLLHDVEFLSTVAHFTKGLDYPQAELDTIWKIVLTNQFHDILPGSSIQEVYVDAETHYKEVADKAISLRSGAVLSLMGEPSGDNFLAINTLGAARQEVVELPGNTPSAQLSANGKPLGIANAPAYGYAVFTPQAPSPAAVKVVETSAGFILENDFVRASFERNGALTSLFDKHAGRESIEPGKTGNHFVMFDDSPNNWDAWDVDVHHLEKRYEVGPAISARLIETGPLRAALEFEYELSSTSTLNQVVSLTVLSPRLDFETKVEWHERRKFLKVEFPIDVRALNANYEIQFGHLPRPTHFNTSWDMARFEVCGHKWADLSELDFGVALLNDCKYGYAAHGNVLRLSLLRSADFPVTPKFSALPLKEGEGIVGDQGSHEFAYALLPHAGSFQSAGVIEEGYRFNVPLQVMPTSLPPQEISFFQVEPAAVIMDTVKKAEDSEEIVVRMYEAHGTRGTATLRSSLPVSSVERCNLLEEREETLEWTANGVSFDYKPFQIISLKLKLK